MPRTCRERTWLISARRALSTFPSRPASERRYMNIRRILFLGHRWLGIALCLFMALWFVSGIVMLYVGYPKLSSSERLRSLPALAGVSCCRSPAEAQAALPKDFGLRSLRLTSIAGKPFYIAGAGKQRFAAVDAENGRLVSAVDEPMA